MKIEVIAIGDAHRTGGDSRDIFSYRPYSASALGRLMGETFPARPRCVRLGDWYDYWLGRGSRVNGCGNGAEFIFNLDRDIILAGNHDPGMGQEQAMLVIGGRKFLFIHGQRFDPWNSGVRRWIGWLATRAAGRVMDFYGSPMRPTGEQVNEWLLRLLGRSNDHSAFEAAAELYRQTMGADVIVCGHTHEAKVTATYANPGAWLNRQYIAIFEDGSFLLKTWE